MFNIKSNFLRSYFPLLLTYFIDNFGLAVVYPIFAPLFLLSDYQLFTEAVPLFTRTILLGFLIASFPLAQFFGAPLIGALSDRIGRKKIFIITIIGGIVGYTLTGIGIHAHQIHLLMIGRAWTGFFAGNLTLCLAAIADISSSEENRIKNFGWIATVGGLSFILAIFIGGSFANPKMQELFSPGLPFFLTAIFSVLNLFVIIFLFQESHLVSSERKIHVIRRLEHLISIIQHQKLRWIYLVYFLFMITWVTSMQFLSAFLIHAFAASINLLTVAFVCIGTLWSFSNFLINPLFARFFTASKTFFLMLISLGILLWIALILQSEILFLSAFLLATFCAALSWTNGLATVSLSASKSIQGGILGINQSVTAMASIIGPLIGGLIGGYDLHLIYLFTGLCSLLGALILYFNVVREKA